MLDVFVLALGEVLFRATVTASFVSRLNGVSSIVLSSPLTLLLPAPQCCSHFSPLCPQGNNRLLQEHTGGLRDAVLPSSSFEGAAAQCGGPQQVRPGLQNFEVMTGNQANL